MVTYSELLVLSFIPIIFQFIVISYLLKVHRYLGGTNTGIIAGLAGLGLVYDLIITGIFFIRPGEREIEPFGLFFGFVFPTARSGLMVWLMYRMKKGLNREDTKTREIEEDKDK